MKSRAFTTTSGSSGPFVSQTKTALLPSDYSRDLLQQIKVFYLAAEGTDFGIREELKANHLLYNNLANDDMFTNNNNTANQKKSTEEEATRLFVPGEQLASEHFDRIPPRNGGRGSFRLIKSHGQTPSWQHHRRRIYSSAEWSITAGFREAARQLLLSNNKKVKYGLVFEADCVMVHST